MSITLEINAHVPFETVEDARAVGQALEKMLQIKQQRMIRLYDVSGESGFCHREIPLYLPESLPNMTRGKQETETRLMMLVKSLRKLFPDLPAEAAIDEEVMILDGPQWRIDYQRLYDNVKADTGVTDAKEVKEVFNSAVAVALQQEATGRVQ